METPLLSIIVPVYNVEPYLTTCLDSLLNQEYTHIEILLIDDGSTDKSGEICDDYASKDGRIIVVHQSNSGVSAARNTGLDKASGSYITFVDPDDFVSSTIYSVNMDKMIKENDIDILQFPECIITTQRRQTFYIWSEYFRGEEEIFKNWWEGKVLRPYVWDKIYKRHIFDKLRFTVGCLSEDWLIIVELSKLANKVFISNEGVYNYVVHDDSLSNSTYTLKMHLNLFAAHLKVYNHLFTFDSLKPMRLRAFSRVYRRLIAAKMCEPECKLDNELESLQRLIPDWSDMYHSKDKDQKVWFCAVKLLGVKWFMLLFCRYQTIRRKQ